LNAVFLHIILILTNKVMLKIYSMKFSNIPHTCMHQHADKYQEEACTDVKSKVIPVLY